MQGKHHTSQQSYYDGCRHCQRMSGPKRQQGRKDRPTTALLHPQRHCEQPTHARIDSVERSQPKEQEPLRDCYLMHLGSRKAVRIGRCIAALQVHLMRTEVWGLQKEPAIQTHTAASIHIYGCHPAVYSIGIKLVVPCAVE